MKKLLSVALTVLLVASLATACAPKAKEAQGSTEVPPGEQPSGLVLRDGTYSEKGEADERGWVPEITVTVSGGKITDVVYDEVTGLKKSEDTGYHEYFKSQKNVDLLAVYDGLQKDLAAKQDVEKVDAVAGATATYNVFKELAAEALATAKNGDSYADGTYKAVGTEDERGWTPNISITVKEGKINAVVYDEVSSKTFKNKSKDEAYRKLFMDLKKVDIVAAYQALQKSLVEKQDAAAVDAYAGATHAVDAFKELAAKVIEQAK